MGRVVVAGRKGLMTATTTTTTVGAGGPRDTGEVGEVQRVPFEEVLRTATVLVICCPRDASTIDLIAEEELRSMRKEAVVVNVARGGIINETALAKALTQGWIAAAATDVLEREPGGRGTTPLLPLEGEVPNLTITPHVAWFAAQTMKNLRTMLKEGLEAWVEGNPVNVVVQGR
jgi:lactate dehydrogenase-like 2-hydroxyacid dehydrogenase